MGTYLIEVTPQVSLKGMDYLKESGVRYLYPKCTSKTMKLGLRKINQ